MIKQNGARYQIIRALATDGMLPASELAEKTSLTAGQVIEIQVIENLQRDDVNELEEAAGYETMMRECGYSADELAAKVGKSRAYIYARIKLTALCEAGRTALRDGKIAASVALLVARIPTQQLQAKALEDITAGWRDPFNYREAAGYIQSRYMLHIKDAAWPLDQQIDVEMTGPFGRLFTHEQPCSACPNRTTNNPVLYPDVSADACTDPDCWARKKAGWIKHLAAEQVAAGNTALIGEAVKRLAPHGISSEYTTVKGHTPVTKDNCKAIERAGLPLVMIENERTGTLIPFVPTKALKKLPKPRKAPPPENEYDREMRQKREAADAETAFRGRLFEGILAAVATEADGASEGARLDLFGMRLVARQFFARIWEESQHKLASRFTTADDGKNLKARTAALARRIDTMPASELLPLIYAIALTPMLTADPWDDGITPQPLLDAAHEYLVDVNAARSTTPKTAPTPTQAPRGGEVLPVEERKAAAHAVQAARAADDDAGEKNEQAAGAAKKPMAKSKNSGRAAAGVTKGAATEAGAQVAA